MDPRARLVLTGGYLLAVALAQPGVWLGVLAFLPWVASRLSRVPAGRLLVRSLWALPFALAALPLPFTVPGPGWSCAGMHGSWAGTQRLGLIVVRAMLSVQAAVWLTAAPWPRLLWGLSRLGMPALLTSVLGLMVRYLEVLRAEAGRRLVARASRSPGARGPGLVFEARVAGSMVGGLMLRTLDRSERVYQAMLSRGYDGRPRLLDLPVLKAPDWLAMAAGLGLLVGSACWR